VSFLRRESLWVARRGHSRVLEQKGGNILCVTRKQGKVRKLFGRQEEGRPPKTSMGKKDVVSIHQSRGDEGLDVAKERTGIPN